MNSKNYKHKATQKTSLIFAEYAEAAHAKSAKIHEVAKFKKQYFTVYSSVRRSARGKGLIVFFVRVFMVCVIGRHCVAAAEIAGQPVQAPDSHSAGPVVACCN